MKIRLLPLGFFAAVLVAGCGKQQTASNSAATPAASGTPAATATPAAPSSAPAATSSTAASSTTPAAAPAAKSGAARVIEISGNDQMKFNVEKMEAKAGEEITVRLTNAGTLPKEAMGHNWVLLQKGTDVNAFAQAAMTAKDTDYVPASMKDKVIASTPVLGPKKSADVTFKAPAAGEYVYICSFPGHYMLMKGTLTVK